MKKVTLFAALIAAMSFISCIKEEFPADQGQAPAAKIVKTVEIPISFQTSEDAEEVDSKAYIGDFSDGKFPHVWEEGDVVKVFMGNTLLANHGTIKVNAEDPAKGTVTISFTENEIPTASSGDITLYYPGTTGTPTAMSDGILPITLPTSQYAAPNGLPHNGWGDYNEGMGSRLLPCLADAGSALDVYNQADLDVLFRNPFALVSFKVDNTLADVQKIVFDTMYKPMGGTFNVNVDGSSQWDSTKDTDNHISLKAGLRVGDTESVFTPGTTYYFLAPAMALQNGFVLTLYKSDGTTVARGAKNPYLLLKRSAVNDLGTLTASAFASDAGFTKTNYPYLTGEKPRIAVVGSFIVLADGTNTLKFYDRITGEWRRDLDVSTIGGGSAKIDMLAVDDAGNLVFGSSASNVANEYHNIYYLTNTITTVQTLGSYCLSSSVANCTGAGNLRVAGDVTKNATITLFANGDDSFLIAFNVANGVLGAPVCFKNVPQTSATIWNWGHAVAHPAGTTIDAGVYFIGYNDEYNVEYAANASSDFTGTSTGMDWKDNPNSMDIDLSNKYLAVGVGAHNAGTQPRVLVYSIADSAAPALVNTWTLSSTSLTGAGAWSDVQIVPVAGSGGDYHLYYLSANNGYFACRKFGPDTNSAVPTPESALKAPKIIAHRGYHTSDIPENSIAAFANAQNAGYYAAEMDAHITSDGTVVIYHDYSINEISIASSTYDQIKDITLSNGEKLPTLEGLLDQMASSNSTTRLILEFKGYSTALVDKSVELIKAKGLEDRVDYISFQYNLCQRVAEAVPGAEVGCLSYDTSEAPAPSALKADGISMMNYSYPVYNNNTKYISQARNLGLKVGVWTLNTEEEFLTWIRQSVDYITTDQPALLQTVISQYCAQ